ncbi:MAG: hypothetical protein GY850_14820, partial [bacterium]|nr:hypothetical protein [bacterium]
TSETDVYAVGDESTLLHYDGNSEAEWELFDNLGLEGTNYSFYSVWGTSDTDIFASGSTGSMAHYNGDQWSLMDTGLTYSDYITQIWGTSSSNVYAVTFSHGDVIKYNGVSWSLLDLNTLFPTGNSPARMASQRRTEANSYTINAVWGTADNNIYFVGENGVVLHYAPEPTLVELSTFDAVKTRGRVAVTWETAAEIDNAGFNIYRSDSEDGNYHKVNANLIPAKGSASSGTFYRFNDTTLTGRKNVWYKLEDVDLSGVATIHGPIKTTPAWLNRIKNSK